MHGTAATRAGTLEAIHRRNAWRVLPLLVAGYVLNSLDKSNIGFASLEMNKDLGLSPAVFGLGAGLFFLTYTAFEIPSNLLMRRLGARFWLSRILISWGIVSMAMALAYDKTSFYLLRLLLGLAEAGWYPGVIFYLSLWFPRAFKARAITLFFLGVPISSVLGGPISGALLSLPPTLGLKGWQWLFLVEGLPTVLLGIAALAVLRDGPEQADWLSDSEKRSIERSLGEGQEPEAPARGSFRARLILFCTVNFANALGLYSTAMWLPRIVKELGSLTNLQTGFATAVPSAFGALALILCAASSDRRRERKWHVVLPLLIGAAGMAGVALSPAPAIKMLFLTIAMMGSLGLQGTLFAMFSESLREANCHPGALAAGLATITTVGNLGGFFGPSAIGLILSADLGYGVAVLTVAAEFALAGAILAFTRRSALGASPVAASL
jgi:MFS transporter, ACS family, tartrate transporter